MAHHGSKNSTSQEFLNIIKPELSLISCSKNNKKITRLIQFRFPCSGLEMAKYRGFVVGCSEIVLDFQEKNIRLSYNNCNRYSCVCTTVLTIWFNRYKVM